MLGDWCSSAWSVLDPELIKRCFTQTGLSNMGRVDREVLHSRLRKLVDAVMEDEDNNNLGSGDNKEEEDEDFDDLPDI